VKTCPSSCVLSGLCLSLGYGNDCSGLKTEIDFGEVTLRWRLYWKEEVSQRLLPWTRKDLLLAKHNYHMDIVTRMRVCPHLFNVN